MNKFVMSFILALGTLCMAQVPPVVKAAADTPVVHAHKSAHRIQVIDTYSGEAVGGCSATAVGPHALLTATHCATASRAISVDDHDTDILGTIGDGLDHMIILVGATYADYTDVNEVKLVEGNEIFIFGNPGSFKDMYRKGYVSGFKTPEIPQTPLEALRQPLQHHGNDGIQVTFLDLNGFFGDSGSGVFSPDGKVVGVTSFITGDDANGYSQKYMGTYELRFSPEQLKQARDFAPPVPVAPVVPEKKHKTIFEWLQQ